ncbi:ATP phosphoribosyltransferase regulatory subunit [Schinkia azotoformans MEV2011]|uniref:ATP phosphoribosyltransferase regulatory subunit n=1 Tax=Schinkia azotoformans MEV2011 TaxID=1348973 RepID=A0A072NS25_SCHAZ|nr:ATP phosphoribosyltransferase regulatory subunit [Schinkia azotoformans]KEF40271.1 ATP phosphoribosyltransferase regulatory subunit [Schinkia azotoformans MEV2011]MEC1696421.1 ATP phosphoribosyltransferase regulatory subunit [Schinkia azotoformans]MEC1724092.1 ATP phosphoribosyltransferase regulatory subunit [Schinkia azotoformans]
MSKLFMFEKPLGMRDTLPELYETKKQARNKMLEEIQAWGYQSIQTPTLEYYETVGAASAISNQQLFKLLDQQGHTLVLRPDMTAPIARVAASRMKSEGYPLRLAYDANVYRAQQREGGRPAEFEQVGVELIGDQTSSADAEVIALMVEVLKSAGLENFSVAIGHVGFVNALFLDILGNEERANVLRRFLYEKNYVGYREHVKKLPLSSIDKQQLLQLLQFRGDHRVIAEAREITENSAARKAIEELDQLWSQLGSYGVTDHIKIDLNIVSHMSYYTGILFEGYAQNLGFSLCSGGRYDQLLEKFNRPTAATGFAIRVDRLVQALGGTQDSTPISLIIFSHERRQEAIEMARTKRKNGEKAVLQDIAGIEDVDLFTSRYQDVAYCIGKPGKESGQ